MQKSDPATLLSMLRTQRGLSIEALSELSGVSHTTIRLIERGSDSTRASTWQQLIRGLAATGALNDSEVGQLAVSLGWSPSAVEQLNQTPVQKSRAADGRQTPRSRVLAALERAEASGATDQLLTIVETFVAALPPPKPVPDPLNPALFETRRTPG